MSDIPDIVIDKGYWKSYFDIDDLETHVYIIYGVFGGLLAILFYINILLCSMVKSLKKKIKRESRDPLNSRGYSVYTGQQQPEPEPVFETEPQQFNRGQSRYQTTNGYPQQYIGNSRPVSQSPDPRGYGGYEYNNNGFEKDRTPGGVRVLPGGKPAPSKAEKYAKQAGKVIMDEVKDELKEQAKDELKGQLKEKFGGLW